MNPFVLWANSLLLSSHNSLISSSQSASLAAIIGFSKCFLNSAKIIIFSKIKSSSGESQEFFKGRVENKSKKKKLISRTNTVLMWNFHYKFSWKIINCRKFKRDLAWNKCKFRKNKKKVYKRYNWKRGSLQPLTKISFWIKKLICPLWQKLFTKVLSLRWKLWNSFSPLSLHRFLWNFNQW